MANSRFQTGNGEIKKTTLKNGLRIVTESIPSVRSISLGVWIDVGSRHETNEENGVSHLIEHMLFKGTKSRNARQIAAALESIGGNLNAFTSKEQTCYTARVLDEHLEIAVDVLSDITCNATFTPPNLKREKMVVMEEIKESDDNPSDHVHDLFAETFWNVNSLGRPILGTADSISKLPRAKILSFLKRNYRSESTVIVAAGSVSHQKFVKLVKKYFNFEAGYISDFKPESRNTDKKTVIKTIDNNQTHLCIGFPGLSYGAPERIAAMAMGAYLGGGMSSVLFQKIREQKGLAYAVFAYNDVYRDTGSFGAYVGTDKKNLNLAFDILLKECYRLKKTKLSSERLNQVKEQIKGQITLSLESTTSRMSRLGRQEIMIGRIVPLEDTLELIDKVTPKDLLSLSNQFFDESKLVVTILGPVEKSDFNYG